MSRMAAVAVGAIVSSVLLGLSASPALAGTLAGTPAATPAPTPSPASSTADVADGSLAAGYPGDPKAEAQLVASEDRRLIDLRSLTNVAQWSGVAPGKPYRLVTGNTYTLVLIPRDAPYTFDDLLRLAPRTLVHQPDGSYLLSESVMVEQGATLAISSKDGLKLHLASGSSAFVSIVTLGGGLTVAGTESQPVTVDAWNPSTGAIDGDTSDGRAYIRVVGGHAELSNAVFDHLGFWSGMTGGVSLTGTQLADSNTSGGLSDKSTTGAPQVFGQDLLSTDGDTSTLALQPDLSGYSYVSARVQNVQFNNDAFGLFITSADGVKIDASSIKNSLVDGLVLHRDVTNSQVSSTTSTANAVDGFALTRSSTGNVLNRVTASGNGRNGISVDGGSLATGPSATGTPVQIYGNNEVSNSISKDNGRYGIDVVGGTNITIDGNTTTANQMGIVVSGGAGKVTIKNNIVEQSVLQGIALREAGTDALVQSNDISGGDFGIYARNAGGTFDRNTIDKVGNHGITLIGATGKSVISKNSVAGSGPSAIDVKRTSGVTLRDNTTNRWLGTKPLDVLLRSIFQPLTIMWVALGLIVLISAISGVGRRKRGVIVDPYANRAPLSNFTRGVVSVDELRGPVAERIDDEADSLRHRELVLEHSA